MIERRSNTKNIVIAILIILVLALAGGCAYLLYFKEEAKVAECKEEKKEEKKEDNDKEYKLEVYGKQYETGAYFICNHKSDTDDCKNVLFTINTKMPNASIIHLYLGEKQSFQYIIYYDDEVKLYNVKDESTKKLDIDINGDILWLQEGFILNGEDEAFYYDLKNDKKTIDKYEYIYPVKDTGDGFYMENPKYISCKKGNSYSLIDFKTGNVILNVDSSKYDTISFEKDGSYIIVEYMYTEGSDRIIYNTKGEKVVELKENNTYDIQGSKLVIYENTSKKVKEY